MAGAGDGRAPGHVADRTGRGAGAEADGFRLVVRAPEEAGGPARFLALRREGQEDRHALLGSGVEESVRSAMEAAARIAGRVLSGPTGDAG